MSQACGQQPAPHHHVVADSSACNHPRLRNRRPRPGPRRIHAQPVVTIIIAHHPWQRFATVSGACGQQHATPPTDGDPAPCTIHRPTHPGTQQHSSNRCNEPPTMALKDDLAVSTRAAHTRTSSYTSTCAVTPVTSEPTHSHNGRAVAARPASTALGGAAMAPPGGEQPVDRSGSGRRAGRGCGRRVPGLSHGPSRWMPGEQPVVRPARRARPPGEPAARDCR